MNIDNEHLNIFWAYHSNHIGKDKEDYTQNERRLIENNLTRVIARFLSEDKADFREFQKNILEFISPKLKNTNIKKVIFQRKVMTIKEYLKKENIEIKDIYFGTLTSSYFRDTNIKDNVNKEDSETIPDIVILTSDASLIFIEAKRDDKIEEATREVIKQVSNFLGREVTKEVDFNLKWNDITRFLENKNNILIKDFREYLQKNFKEYFRYYINEIIKSNNIDINKIKIRLENLIKNYALDNNLEYGKFKEYPYLKLKGEFTDRLEINFNKTSYDLEVSFWSGETIREANLFLEFVKNKEILEKLINNIDKDLKKYHANIKLIPYLLVRDIHNYVYDKTLDNGDLDEMKSLVKKYAHRYEGIDDFEKRVGNYNNLGDIIKDKYDGSLKTRKITLSFGYQVKINYPFNYYKSFDSFKGDKDNLSVLLDISREIFRKHFKIEFQENKK